MNNENHSSHSDDILVVDDTPDNIKLLKNLLGRAGYKVRPASNGALALAAVNGKKPDLILLDINMPGMDGFEVCRHLRNSDQTKDIPIIFVTASTDIKGLIKGFHLGAVDYITKPFHEEEVLVRVGTHLELAGMRKNLAWLVSERTQQLNMALESVIQVAAKIVEQRDPYTAGHQKRVAELACAIAREMGLDENTIEGIKYGGLIHDIGKIHIPVEFLTKPTRLSDSEFRIIQTHSEVGYSIVRDIEFPWPMADIIHQHHERLDGSGYPQGLKGDDIIQEARIVAVADVVEAMSSSRPYRQGLGIEKALEEIERGSNKIYDSNTVNACLRLFHDKGFEFEP
ncbi:MAG: response regulator [Candidatus Sedimenticola sp. (ex Thyasira tokunagai)]